MRLTTRIRRIIEAGGPLELFKGIGRFVYWQTGIRAARYILEYRLKGSPVPCTVNGMTARFEASTPKEYSRVRTLHGERTVLADLVQTLESDDVFYDIGANVGIYSCFAGRFVGMGNVVAFEPHPGNVDRLQENAELNDVNVDIRSVALSSETGTTELVISGGTDVIGVGTHSLSTKKEGRTLTIETVEGDKLIADDEIPPPSVLKIDVEGAEQLVLEGLTSTLESERCHTLYCEVHPDRLPDFGGSERELRNTLEENGFSFQVIEHRSPEYFLKAERSDG